jgi:hypothetical protein
MASTASARTGIREALSSKLTYRHPNVTSARSLTRLLTASPQ